jgi:hypothetical protein
MADHMSTSNGGSFPGAAGSRGDREVRISKDVFRILTCALGPLCDVGRDQIPRLAHPGWPAGCCEPDNCCPERFPPRSPRRWS